MSKSRTVDGCRRIWRTNTFTACPDRQRRHTSSTSAGDNAVRAIRITPSLAETKIMKCCDDPLRPPRESDVRLGLNLHPLADVSECHRALRSLRVVFNMGQRSAVQGAFKLAGYDGPLKTLPVDSEDERIFVLSAADFATLSDVRTLEQVLQQVLGRKVWIIEQLPDLRPSIPFE